MTESSPVPPLLRVAGHLILSAVAFGLAWWLWELAQYDHWMFHIYAALCALGGVIRFGKALIELIKLWWQRRSWARLEAKGVAPKADKTVSEDDLRRRGLFK